MLYSNLTQQSLLKLFTMLMLLGSITSSTYASPDIKPTNNSNGQSTPIDINLLNRHVINNRAAYIPAQCYTKTMSADNKIHNPCFSCHTQGLAPNYIDDSSFQIEYDFRTYSRTNRWTNLFKDRTKDVAKISDETILNYIKTSNYFNQNDEILLSKQLKSPPKSWDVNQNGKWDGYTPDCYFNFDNEGFDKTPNNKDSGWRAFAYTPFLGTFWPTNGSTDDVIIRLPESMRKDKSSQYSRDIYKVNLAIVEAMITRKNVTIEPQDEKLFGVDLNRNGILDIASQITYEWIPTQGKNMSYVGLAKNLQEKGKLNLAAGLYPEGTEFLHTVRYIDFDDNQTITLSKRIKEIRYAKKTSWNKYSQLYNAAQGEALETRNFPDRLRRFVGNSETGLINGLGWTYQGFIEDTKGFLRPQTFEETMNCIGCHSGIGVTTDSSFAFPRKLNADNHQAGWYHWTQKGIQGIAEPKYNNGTWQYTEYLLNNHSANEFRNNHEVISKFYKKDGSLKPKEIERLHKDISHLLQPSEERAIQLNKAYKVIVDEQSYIYGRDPHIKPVTTSWDIVPIDEKTGIEKPILHN